MQNTLTILYILYIIISRSVCISSLDAFITRQYCSLHNSKHDHMVWFIGAGSRCNNVACTMVTFSVTVDAGGNAHSTKSRFMFI